MPRISRQHAYDYSIQEIQAIATRTGTQPQHINRIVSGEGKTKSEKIAAEVSILTGKPAELYLVSQGVRIDSIPPECSSLPETYEMERIPADGKFSYLSDLDILAFQQELSILQAEVAIEMRERMKPQGG